MREKAHRHVHLKKKIQGDGQLISEKEKESCQLLRKCFISTTIDLTW